MKRIWALSAIVILVLSFQNCGESMQQGMGNFSSTGVNVGIPNQASMSSARVTDIEIPHIADASSLPSKITEDYGPYRLLVSLESGDIQLLDESNNVLQRRCLGSNELNEAKTILADSKICETSVQSDQVCGMRYKYAYASLYADDKRVSLGEEQDSCGRGKKDLCGGLASVFQAYISHIKANWDSMSCE